MPPVEPGRHRRFATARSVPAAVERECVVELITIEPIGRVVGGRAEVVDDDWAGVKAMIVLDDRFPSDASFSHLEVLFHFDRVDPTEVHTGACRPRGRDDWPEVGIFAQRAKARPNRLGLTTVEIVRVEGRRIGVRGLDAVDGTPVVDVKPTMQEFLPRSEVVQPAWSVELMSGYW